MSDLVQIVDYTPTVDPPPDEGVPVSMLLPPGPEAVPDPGAAETSGEAVAETDPTVAGEVVAQ